MQKPRHDDHDILQNYHNYNFAIDVQCYHAI